MDLKAVESAIISIINAIWFLFTSFLGIIVIVITIVVWLTYLGIIPSGDQTSGPDYQYDPFH